MYLEDLQVTVSVIMDYITITDCIYLEGLQVIVYVFMDYVLQSFKCYLSAYCVFTANRSVACLSCLMVCPVNTRR